MANQGCGLWMNVVDQLNQLPYELLENILRHLPGGALQLLGQESARIHRITKKSHFRHRWLQTYGGISFAQLPRCPRQQGRLLRVSYELDERWARALYGRMTVGEKVAAMEELLEEGVGSGGGREVAKELASIDRMQDLKMQDRTYGIYYRHLKWRLRHHGCSLSP